MLSLSALARRLDLPYPRAVELVRAGKLQPSAIGPKNTKLFVESRVDFLRERLASLDVGGLIR